MSIIWLTFVVEYDASDVWIVYTSTGIYMNGTRDLLRMSAQTVFDYLRYLYT